MQLATGIIVNGRVEIEGLDLPEGTRVTVLARDDSRTVVLTPDEEAELREALADADREEGIPAEELFARLHRLG